MPLANETQLVRCHDNTTLPGSPAGSHGRPVPLPLGVTFHLQGGTQPGGYTEQEEKELIGKKPSARLSVEYSSDYCHSKSYLSVHMTYARTSVSLVGTNQWTDRHDRCVRAQGQIVAGIKIHLVIRKANGWAIQMFYLLQVCEPTDSIHWPCFTSLQQLPCHQTNHQQVSLCKEEGLIQDTSRDE